MTDVALSDHLTEMGNARRLVLAYHKRLRYVPEMGIWLTWQANRWERDRTGRIDRVAKDVVRQMHEHVAHVEDRTEAEKLSKWAFRSETERQLKAMIAIAKSEPEVPLVPEQLDADPWLFNCVNGTLDLRTGTLRAHDPGDYITKLSPVAYDPAATAPTFDAFLTRILGGDPDLIAFVQRAVGCSMAGVTIEHVLLFLFGVGANGKTTLLNLLIAAFGEYGQQAEAELLMQRRGESHPTGLAKLKGARLVVASEVDEGRKMAEATLKRLTGGDRITARFLYRDFFEFDPTHTVWLAANHRPIVRGTDVGIWRRIKLVPFNVVIPEPERDPHLGEKLRAELPGILAWAVRGCLEWQRVGLAAPKAVEAATTDYRNAMDALGGFFEDRCTLDSEGQESASDLYAAYDEWAKRTGERPMSNRRFGESLQEHDFERFKHPTTRKWTYRGIRINTGSETVRNVSPALSLVNPSCGEVTGDRFGLFRNSEDEEYEKAEREALEA